nr:MAG TPA: hypothetical protein [Caudoviricetes sp.]
MYKLLPILHLLFLLSKNFITRTWSINYSRFICLIKIYLTMPESKQDTNQFVSIPWEDGTADNFYLNFSYVISTGTITISSDKNSSNIVRTKTLVFKGATDDETQNTQASVYLHITQQVNNLVVATFVDTTSIYNNVKAGNSI